MFKFKYITILFFLFLFFNVKSSNAQEMELLYIEKPVDKAIVREGSILVYGKANSLDIQSIYINGKPVEIKLDNSFTTKIPLKIGKNLIEIVGYNATMEALWSERFRILRLVSFKDVPVGYWAKDQIESLATLGIIGGYKGGIFKPEGGVTRAELAVLLVKAKGGELEAPQKIFKDVALKNWANRYILTSLKAGYIKGYKDRTFRPNLSMDKAEGIASLARFASLEEPERIYESPFPSFSPRHWSARIITSAKNAGLLKYLEGRTFNPNAKISRAEVTEILTKIDFISKRIAELNDWEVGY